MARSDRAGGFRLPPLAAVAVIGTTTGLPLMMAGGTLQAWLKSGGIELEWIGVFALTGIPYLLKPLWAPLLDRFRPPFGGRRRGWILVMILAIQLAAILLALCDPTRRLWPMAVLAFAMAFCSASADINIDALRVEMLPSRLAGLGSTLHFVGLQVGMLAAGALALWLSDRMPWRTVYFLMAAGMVPGALATLLAPEPAASPPPRSLREAALLPLVDFFQRRRAMQVMAFIMLFKLGDGLAMTLNIPFLMDMGFSRSAIALAAQNIGIPALAAGWVAGGWLMHRFHLLRALWILGFLQLASILLTFALALGPPGPLLLGTVTALGNSFLSMGTVGLLTLTQRVCSPGCAVTQFAILSSLAAVPRVLCGGSAGLLAHCLGWPGFFACCAILAVPGLLLLLQAGRWELGEDASAVPSNQRNH
jgi:PAT family beta-lactamase induction signal transducer AmpG